MGKSGPECKSFQISKQLVWEAYKQVKRNKGAPGADGQSIEDFETDLKNNLYKIWNRMSSGTYFPPPVRAVEIPKPHGGGTRTLGVPTVADRIAQTVAALALEPRTESIFHKDSYGYRPKRGALDAVAKCRERCWKKDWVLDLDVQKFFDSVDHDLMVKAVEANTNPGQAWVVLYVKRWLKAPMQLPDGTLAARDRGTPQGSAVSPVLANLFTHYAFDSFLEREFPAVEFERYADDAVIHCVTEQQARQVRAALEQRMAEVGLRLHPGQNQDRVLQGRQAERELPRHRLHVPGVHLPSPRSATPRRQGPVHRVPARGQRGRPAENAHPDPRLAAPPAHRNQPRRARQTDQPHRQGLDDLLWPVLPVGHVPPPRTREHLPHALGGSEVPTTARLQTVQAMVGRGHRKATRPARPLGLGALVRRTAMRRAE